MFGMVLRSTTLWSHGSNHAMNSLAFGSWAIQDNSTLALSTTSCGGDTMYTCLNSAQNVTYTLVSKGNSLVLLGSSDGSSDTTYAYQPGF